MLSPSAVSRQLTNRARAWLALSLVGLAYRIAPAGALPPLRSAQGLPQGNRTNFRVDRQVGVTQFCIYDGVDGGAARRAFEGVKSRGELGTMELVMTEAGRPPVVRGSYADVRHAT